MSGLKFLVEGAKFAYVDKVYKGEAPFEPGVQIVRSLPATSFWSGEDPRPEEYYIFEFLKEIEDRFRQFRESHKNWKNTHSVYLGYHITSEPMSWDEASERYQAMTLGAPVDSYIYHSYSDLTGYLWTTVDILDEDGHNIYKEMCRHLSGIDYFPEDGQGSRYLTMLFEVELKDG